MNILIFNLFISLFCSIPILLYFKYPQLKNNHFQNYFIILIIKLLFISMFIYIIIHNFSGVDLQLFIITGYSNFFIFHILEGFISQNNLLK